MSILFNLGVSQLYSFVPYLQKELVSSFDTSYDYSLFSHFAFYHVAYLVVLVILYFFRYDYLKKLYNVGKNLDKKIYGYGYLATILSLITTLCYYNLMKHYDVSYFLPIYRGISNLTTLLIGVCLFNEKTNMYQIIGAIIVFIGISIMNLKKK